MTIVIFAQSVIYQNGDKMKLFKEPPLPSHKELDMDWAKLNRKHKQEALWYIKVQMAAVEQREAHMKLEREAEKGKKVGRECTCIPKYKNGCNVVLLCSYCRNQYYKDLNNSPG